jgi:hypothetical protein
MSDALYGFATGFADGFTKSYSARLANDAAEKKDKIRFGAQAWLSEKSTYDANEAADAARVTQAEAFVRVNNLPENSVMNIYDMLEAKITPANIMKQINSTGAVWEDVVPTDTASAQTNAMLGGGGADVTVGKPIASTVVDVEGSNSTSTAKADPNNPFTKYAQEIQDTVGADSDYFDLVLGGYKRPDRTPTMRFTPGRSSAKTENLSFEKQAVLAAQNDPEWDDTNYSNNITILAKYKKNLSGDEKAQTFESPKELAVFNLMNSTEYTQLKGQPDAQNDMLVNLEGMFRANSTTAETLTAGVYTSQVSKYTMMLTSVDEGEREKAEQWFLNVKPAHDAAFKAHAALTETPDDAPVFAITYMGKGGKSIYGTAIKDPEVKGGYILANDEKIDKDQVTNSLTFDMFDARTKAVQAASTVYGEVSKAQVSTSVAATNLMALDRMVFDNEAVLTTLEGGGTSLFVSGKNELAGVMRLLGEMQQADPEKSTKRSLLDGINGEVDNLLSTDRISEDTARAYKEFNAAVVRTIFATGKALGQSGNGFSNQDYRVISQSLVNANSYEAFSNNLRRLTNELYEGWDAQAVSAQNHALVQNVMRFPGGEEIVGNSVLGVKQYYDSEMGSNSRHVYAWSQGTSDNLENSQVFETADASLVAKGMPKSMVGKKVILFSEVVTDASGNKTATTSWEEY